MALSKLYSASREDAQMMTDIPGPAIAKEPGTPVESGRIFSIIAHELRSPLGVIQGYVRMLRTRRGDDDPETRMLTAILDATGRISAVARHASEFAVWCDAPPPGQPARIAVAALVQRIVDSQALPRPLGPSAGVGDAHVATGHTDAIVGALIALVIWTQRNQPDREIRIAASGSIVTIGAAEGMPADHVSSEAAARARERVFTAGGQGLALVLARTVLDHHDIRVGLIEAPTDVIVLQLPKDRGLS